MDITLEQGIAAVVRYMQDNAAKGTKLYFDEIPENFYVPSIYFKPPYTRGAKATLGSYRTTYTMYVWFMEHLDWDAQWKAGDMRDGIMLDGCMIPVVDSEGAETGSWLRVTPPETQKIDEGIVQLSFSFDVYFQPGAQADKAQKFYYAWKTAQETEE